MGKRANVFYRVRKFLFLLGTGMAAWLFTGCGAKLEEGTTVILTTGFAASEVFRLDKISCTLPEIMVYLTNTQNQYESVFGAQIWETSLDGVTLEENVKETVLARIAQIKAMNLLAVQHNVALSDNEAALVEQAATQYYNGLNEIEIECMGVTRKTIIQLYSEYALANKVYHYIIKDINPEISDDEARTITVEHIFIKTYTLNGLGEKISYTDKPKAEAYQKAQNILKQIQEGADFEKMMEEYNEDSKNKYSFGKGEMEAEFERVAFNLASGEVSGVVETEYGYHIIKCISTFDKAETDANKVKIVEERKKEVFNQEYDEFVASLTKNLNQELWDSVTFIHNPEVVTKDFFEVYGKYFE